MEKEGKSQKGSRGTERDFVLQWGSKKKHRLPKVKKNHDLPNKSKSTDSLTKKKITSRVSPAEKKSASPQPHHLNKTNMMMNNRKLATSPEKEDRYYTTRGSLGLDDNGKALLDIVKEDKRPVWPKLFITLSSKEKEEDFMAMKGCKPPQRPKKRAKLVQRSLLLVSPGAWLTDLCQERYEVREKKTSKKRPRGLKAMGSMESDSE
ncbi:hypothetical protein HS088_TW04G00796 [Tripterygium wilfordii]|uniref:Uncharacterized protein n=1 Tax=Tripterygium wilfordii TaxID=458696 RepID=A0A7J7DRT1_TRIWF|nr:uncharacterized protein LOC119997492 [Tripterygium wilfordii]XP_038700486.1 uncharacterized protein LOC119997492 [Tripterygium wilfordii]XP_038700487.1 uncharacterized protein LOC119997492 [Tripterygium wilfordii]XP_038700488.1 uncharacterized protein LOC119997492 [Tripterygium wilfordii]KAF5748836.1 hypothetical protein HS088_TW04G00796 [Tripterygium wilfordii]